MARPESNTVSYYPHIPGEGKKMYFIDKKYGNDGYATWFKILDKIAVTDYHYLNLNKEEELMFLSSKCNITEDRLLSIINDLVKLGKFDKELWENRIIWDQSFIDSIQEVYNKRNNKCMTIEGLRIILHGLGILKQIKGTVKLQSIVEYTKVKERRVFSPPSLEEVLLYFKENNFDENTAIKAFKYYDVANWKDSKGNQVLNWKQKMQSVWFKEENKVVQQIENTKIPVEPMNKRQPIMGR